LGIVATISNEIVLNSDNLPGPFTTNVGALGGHTLTYNVISGNSDVNWAASSGSGGAGTIQLAAKMSYTGSTSINTGVNTGAGMIKLLIDDAFPTATVMTFNTATDPGGFAGPSPLELN